MRLSAGMSLLAAVAALAIATQSIGADKKITKLSMQKTGLMSKVVRLPTAKAKLNDNYMLVLVNMSNNVYTVAATKQAGTPDASYVWINIPAVGHNCSLGSFDACVEKKQFSPIMSIPCSNPTFDIFVGQKPDAQGRTSGAEFTGIRPDCHVAGGAIGIAP